MRDGTWTSSHASAYPPDMNYHIAKALASLRPAPDMLPQPVRVPPPNSVPIPVAVAQPISAVPTTSTPQPAQTDTACDAHAPEAATAPAQDDTEPARRASFQRGLGLPSPFIRSPRHSTPSPARCRVAGSTRPRVRPGRFSCFYRPANP
eukprot:1040203-Pleurochrysis_carterae.AAC.1